MDQRVQHRKAGVIHGGTWAARHKEFWKAILLHTRLIRR